MSSKIQQRNEVDKTMLFVKAKMDLWSTIFSGALAMVFPNAIARAIDNGSWNLLVWGLLIAVLIINIFAIRLFLWRVGGIEVVTISSSEFSYERRGTFLAKHIHCKLEDLGEIRKKPFINESTPETPAEELAARGRSRSEYMFTFNGEGKIQFRHNNQWHAIFSNLQGKEINAVLTRLHELVDKHRKSDHSPK